MNTYGVCSFCLRQQSFFSVSSVGVDLHMCFVKSLIKMTTCL